MYTCTFSRRPDDDSRPLKNGNRCLSRVSITDVLRCSRARVGFVLTPVTAISRASFRRAYNVIALCFIQYFKFEKNMCFFRSQFIAVFLRFV